MPLKSAPLIANRLFRHKKLRALAILPIRSAIIQSHAILGFQVIVFQWLK